MNTMVYKLSGKIIPGKPSRCPRKLTIDDNIGESVHLHYRNFRIEFRVKDYLKFAENIALAKKNLEGLK
jgi:hypothetical protein